MSSYSFKPKLLTRFGYNHVTTGSCPGDQFWFVRQKKRNQPYCLSSFCEILLWCHLYWYSESIPDGFVMTFPLCSCGLPRGKGLSREGPRFPGRLCDSQVSGVRQPSALFLLVQRGRTAHLQRRWQTQTRYITHLKHIFTYDFCTLYFGLKYG